MTTQLDEKYILKINGREFVKYEGLLMLAHEKGLVKLEVTPIQYPTKENGNEAICKAVLTSKNGECFTDVGDANPNNVDKLVSAHILRMASTRAKSRCLRDFTNTGMTAIEELGGIVEEEKVVDSGSNGNGRSKKPKEATAKTVDGQQEVKAEGTPPATTKPAKHGTNGNGNGSNGNGTKLITEAQKLAVDNLTRRRGISADGLDQMVKELYNTTFAEITSQGASSLIRHLQHAA